MIGPEEARQMRERDLQKQIEEAGGGTPFDPTRGQDRITDGCDRSAAQMLGGGVSTGANRNRPTARRLIEQKIQEHYRIAHSLQALLIGLPGEMSYDAEQGLFDLLTARAL